MSRSSATHAGTGAPTGSKALLLLLGCGIASTLLYIGTDIVATILWKGYDYTSQQVSELSAVGAPTRALWLVMTSVYGPLVIAFGVGVWMAARSRLSLRITSILLIAFGLIGMAWAFFAPMHLRGTVGFSSDSDVMHLVFAILQVLVMVLFMAFGSGAGGKAFRIYSILTIVAMLAAGAVAGSAVQAIAAGQATPWMGLVERVSVYAPEVWILTFGVVMWRQVTARAAVGMQPSHL